jgi:amidophosphoribosyltransferase
MKRVVAALNPRLDGVEASCFDGVYITGDVSAAEFDAMAAQRSQQGEDDEGTDRARLALQSATETI